MLFIGKIGLICPHCRKQVRETSSDPVQFICDTCQVVPEPQKLIVLVRPTEEGGLIDAELPELAELPYSLPAPELPLPTKSSENHQRLQQLLENEALKAFCEMWELGRQISGEPTVDDIEVGSSEEIFMKRLYEAATRLTETAITAAVGRRVARLMCHSCETLLGLVILGTTLTCPICGQNGEVLAIQESLAVQ